MGLTGFSKPRSVKRTFVIGLDGVPCGLLRRLMDEGVMPELSNIVKEGTLMPMQASLPEVSSTSWSTFMTGVNPAKHGIYGFMDLKKGSYDIYFPRSSDIKSETFWDIAGKQQKRSIVLNVPSTYPARPVNGILTAGFVAVDLEKATYPKEAYAYLKEIGYRMDVDNEMAVRDIEAFKKDVDNTFEKRQEAFKFFLDNEHWDIFIAAITETDRLHHFFFDGFADKNHPMHDFLINFYRKIDNMAGYFYKKVKDDNTLFLIISDHGFTSVKKEVYLNAWLKENGYLRFNTDSPGSLAEIDARSSAFCLDPSRIYINLKGKYPSGAVSRAEYEPVREKIRQGLLGLKIEGEDAIKEAFFKEDIYFGPCLDDAPDIVVLANEGFDLKGAIKKNEVYGKGVFTGAHTRENAVLFINMSVKAKSVNIADIAPTILSSMGLSEGPGPMDGKSILAD